MFRLCEPKMARRAWRGLGVPSGLLCISLMVQIVCLLIVARSGDSSGWPGFIVAAHFVFPFIAFTFGCIAAVEGAWDYVLIAAGLFCGGCAVQVVWVWMWLR